MSVRSHAPKLRVHEPRNEARTLPDYFERRMEVQKVSRLGYGARILSRMQLI